MRERGHAAWRLLSVALGCLAMSLGLVGAEVGVFHDDDGAQLKATGPYVFTIVDDPDPFGMRAWQIRSQPQAANRSVLNPQGYSNGDGRPSILYNATSELPIVAWARNSPSGFDVVISVFEDGAWTAPETVAGSPDNELDASLVVNPSDGSVHLFYRLDGATPVILYRSAPPDLSSWSAPVQVADGVYPSYRPAGVFHDGVLRVIYEVHDYGAGQTPRQVVLAREEGGSFIPEIMAASYHEGELWPQVHSHSGRLWVDWIDSDDEVAWARLDGQGQWEPTIYEPYGSTEELEFHVRGAIRAKATQSP